jgi:hypothetical protein
MKKFVYLIMLLLITSCIVSCSDSDNNESYNPTDAEYLPDNYPYKISFGDFPDTEDPNDFLFIIIGFEETDEIILRLNGNDIETSLFFGCHIGGFITDDEINTYQLIVNGSETHEFTLKSVPVVEANWPTFYPLGDAFDLEWSLSPDEDPMHQEIIYQDNENFDNDHLAVLDPSDREFTIPAEWNIECEDFHFEIELWVINYDVDNDLLATSVCLSMGDYCYLENKSDYVGKLKEFLEGFTVK